MTLDAFEGWSVLSRSLIRCGLERRKGGVGFVEV
jgi:hypothetical protein